MTTEKFVVNAVRQLVIDERKSDFEWVNFLVNATSMAQASELIEKHLKSHEIPIVNSSGQTFFWQFVKIESVNPIIAEFDNMTELQIKVFNHADPLYQVIFDDEQV